MKFIFSFIAIYTLSYLSAFAQFGTVEYFGPKPLGTTQAMLLDFDNDGDIDVILNSNSQKQLILVENLGEGNWSEMQVLWEGVEPNIALAFGDFDLDGDLDIVSVSTESNEIAWYENNGSGVLIEKHIITTEIVSPHLVEVADLDGDNYPDIIIGTNSGGKIVWFKNQEGNGFLPGENLITGITNVTSLEAVELSGDNRLDLLMVHDDPPKVYWYTQEEEMEFSPNPPLLISTYQPSIEVKAADIDNDGDNDIVIGGHWNDLSWFKNDGTGTFTQHVINAYDDPVNLCTSLTLFDVDDDGDLDLVISYAFISNPPVIAWFENMGDGNFGPSQIFFTNPLGESDIQFSDLDGNGTKDLVTVSTARDQVSWIPNQGDGTFLNRRELTNSYKYLGVCKAVDLNNDSLPDLLIASTGTGKIAWYRNMGGGQFDDLEFLIHTEFGIKDIRITDMDGDGDLDMLWIGRSFGSSSVIGWTENLGDFTFGNSTVIMENNGWAYFGDLDLDGNDDIVWAGNPSGGGVEWPICWNKQISPGVYSVTDTLSFFQNPFGELEFFDLDGDGDMDILTTGSSPTSIQWFENLGNNQFSSVLTIDVIQGGSPSIVFPYDFDGDGDLDLIAKIYIAEGVKEQLVTYENLGGGVFGERTVVHSSKDKLRSVSLVDIDRDGEKDIVVNNYTKGRISAFLNMGQGNFGEELYLTSLDDFSIYLYGADLDRDNDLDLYGFNTEGKFFTIENLWYYPNQIRGRIYIDENQNGQSDTLETGINFIQVSSQPESAYSYSYNDGRYFFLFNDSVESTVTILPANLPGWELTSDSASYTISIDSGSTYIDGLNFGFFPDSIYTRLGLDIVGGFPRCNDLVNYWISILNTGTSIPSGIVHLELDELLTYQSTDVAPDSIIGQNIYWHFDSLFYFSEIKLKVVVLMPPFSNTGSTLISSLNVEQTEAENETAYTASTNLQQNSVCAYDPNDKAVTPSGIGNEGFIAKDEELEYLIRFQNTGTDTAFTVIIKDHLAAELDLSTFEPVSSSHEMQPYVQSDGLVEFRFYNIQLPDSGVDLLGSQGYINFRVRPVSGLLPNTPIYNHADIYFDYNPAIITNSVLSTIECYTAPEVSITYSSPSLLTNEIGGAFYQWYLNDTLIQGAENATYIPEENGNFSVYVIDENGCATLSEGFEFISLGTSLLTLTHPSIYPNPSSGAITFSFGEGNQGMSDLLIYNALGVQVTHLAKISGEKYIMPKGSLIPGLYIALLKNTETNDIIFKGKFVVQR